MAKKLVFLVGNLQKNGYERSKIKNIFLFDGNQAVLN